MPDSSTRTAITRRQVWGFRWRAQQLDRAFGTVGDADQVALLDFGVQNTGPHAARWALSNRGWSIADQRPEQLLLAWTLRSAPHMYRREDAAQVALATAPLSEADAARRVLDAARPLQQAGTAVLDGLAEVARAERELVPGPTPKGELSTALSGVLDPRFLRDCRPCNATHVWEVPFRISALQAGLELQPDTSPPVLQRIDGLRPPMFSRSGAEAEPRFNVIRNYLRFYGPARRADVAAFLDAPVTEITAHWPEDAVPVEVTDGPPGTGEAFLLADDAAIITELEPPAADDVRLLGPFDAYLQLRDRDLLVDHPARAKELWRSLGRPGAVAAGGEVVGTWRPKSVGSRLTVIWEPWRHVDRTIRMGVVEQAHRLATTRGKRFGQLLEN